jgi:hypothetical protein
MLDFGTNYPIIQPPFQLKFREMTREQAKQYLEWFQDQIPIRTEVLSHYVRSSPNYHIWEPDLKPSSLNKLGEWFVAHVKTRKRSTAEVNNIYANAPDWFKNIEIPDYDLTTETISLSMDIGIYFSEVLEKNISGLHWKLVTKPIRSIDYQQPVLAGPGKLVFNPVHIMITYAYGISDHSKGPERLRELYEIWAYLLQNEQ